MTIQNRMIIKHLILAGLIVIVTIAFDVKAGYSIVATLVMYYLLTIPRRADDNLGLESLEKYSLNSIFLASLMVIVLFYSTIVDPEGFKSFEPAWLYLFGRFVDLYFIIHFVKLGLRYKKLVKRKKSELDSFR